MKNRSTEIIELALREFGNPVEIKINELLKTDFFFYLSCHLPIELQAWLWGKLELLGAKCPDCGWGSLHLENYPHETWEQIWEYHLWKEGRERLQTINPFCHHEEDEDDWD